MLDADQPWPRLSISQVTTYSASFAEDVAAYKAAGAEGIGIWEYKLEPGRDEEAAAAIREAGLVATLCCPEVPSIIPDAFFSDPANPAERVGALCAAVERLAVFDPLAVLVLSGDPGFSAVPNARRVAVEGLKRVADVAGELGLTLGLEPIRKTSGTMITTLPETVEMIEEIGAPNVSIIADVWHFWDLPTMREDILAHVDRIVGLQVNDYRAPTRSWCDRAVPGDGIADLPSILGLLDEAGYRGWYDVEIFSDNGAFGTVYEDSLWNLPAEELARRAVDGFRRAWESRPRAAG